MTDIITVEPRALMPVMDIETAIARRSQMVQFVKQIMVKGTDYGIIPGTGDKNVLLKPGAEKLTTFFGLTVRFETRKNVEDWTGRDHDGEPFFYYRFACLLYQGERLIVEADGSCSSFESKYRYRQAQRVCPSCGEAAIIKGQKQYGGGWVCWKKRGGCGGKFGDNDTSITGQNVGRIANPDVADQVNTVLKMAQKRALIAATLLGVNASEFFTQDLEDFEAGTGPTPEAKKSTKPPKQTGQTDREKRDGAPPADSTRRSKKAANGNGSAQRGAIDWDAFFPVLANMYEMTVEQVKKRLGDLGQYQSSADAKATMDARPGENAPQVNGERVGGGWDTWPVSDRNGFWAKAGELGLPNDSLHKEMGVESMKDYGESPDKARAILDILGYGQEQGLGLGDVWAALGVKAIHVWAGTVDDAKAAIDEWAAAQDTTVQQQGELAV